MELTRNSPFCTTHSGSLTVQTDASSESNGSLNVASFGRQRQSREQRAAMHPASEEHDVAHAAVAPLHAKRPGQTGDGFAPSDAVRHCPLKPSWLHVSQGAPHALAQQTPSTQNVLAHWEPRP